MSKEIAVVEQQIMELTQKLAQLRRDAPGKSVPNYVFKTFNGEARLLDIFGERQTLFAIHNMGQGCRYCTLWADGLNSFLPHLEDQFAVVLLSKDAPELQQRFANSRGWRYRMASHGGGDYIREQTVSPGEKYMPGLVVYTRSGDQITRKSSAIFGPGDLYCSIWHILALAGIPADDWTPQYGYWQRPAPKTMDDSGQNLR